LGIAEEGEHGVGGAEGMKKDGIDATEDWTGQLLSGTIGTMGTWYIYAYIHIYIDVQ
jgi:hypothetical protein